MSTSFEVADSAELSQIYSNRTSRLRIAIVNDAIPGRNGVGTYYADLVQHLKSQVEDMQIVGPGADRDPSLERFSIAMPGDATQRMSWPIKRKLCGLLDRMHPNVIVIPSLGAFSYYALKYARQNDVPVAVVNHTNFEELVSLYVPVPFRNAASWSLARIGRWLMRQATSVAAMDAEALESARQAGIEHVRVMGTPLPHEFLCTPTKPLPDSIRRVVFVGRLAKEKCVSKFLDAARDLPDIQFTVIGDGPLQAIIQDASQRLLNVRFIGWVSRERVMLEIDNAEILVLPSVIETFGTVALEALARRRYVLTTENCGISKWPSISTGLFTIGSEESVAQSISRISQMHVFDRNKHAERSWNEVRKFNQHTIRVWTSFLADVASSNPKFGKVKKEAEAVL